MSEPGKLRGSDANPLMAGQQRQGTAEPSVGYYPPKAVETLHCTTKTEDPQNSGRPIRMEADWLLPVEDRSQGYPGSKEIRCLSAV